MIKMITVCCRCKKEISEMNEPCQLKCNNTISKISENDGIATPLFPSTADVREREIETSIKSRSIWGRIINIFKWIWLKISTRNGICTYIRRIFETSTQSKQKINNIIVIHRKKNEMFTTNIDLKLNDSDLEDSSYSNLYKVIFRPEENAIIMKIGISKTIKIKLEDKESVWIKLKRSLIGINWNELEKTDEKSVVNEIDNLKKQLDSLRDKLQYM